jgi:hypothetical protein
MERECAAGQFTDTGEPCDCSIYVPGIAGGYTALDTCNTCNIRKTPDASHDRVLVPNTSGEFVECTQCRDPFRKGNAVDQLGRPFSPLSNPFQCADNSACPADKVCIRASFTSAHRLDLSLTALSCFAANATQVHPHLHSQQPPLTATTW